MHDVVLFFREGGAHGPAVITTTDTVRFTTHLHTVPHGPRCSKNAARFPTRLPRRVSDEVFDESFCEFFIPTEDCPTATKWTGLRNTRKLFKMESFEVLNERDFVFVIQHVKLEMTRQ